MATPIEQTAWLKAYRLKKSATLIELSSSGNSNQNLSLSTQGAETKIKAENTTEKKVEKDTGSNAATDQKSRQDNDSSMIFLGKLDKADKLFLYDHFIKDAILSVKDGILQQKLQNCFALGQNAGIIYIDEIDKIALKYENTDNSTAVSTENHQQAEDADTNNNLNSKKDSSQVKLS